MWHAVMLVALLKFRIYNTLRNNLRMGLSEFFVILGLGMLFVMVYD